MIHQSAQTNAASPPTRPLPGRLLRELGTVVGWCGLALLTAWAAALYIDVRIPWLRVPLAGVYGLTVLAVWVWVKCRWLTAGMTAGGFALVLTWWFTLQPANDRDWQPDLAVLPYADVNGNQITLHNIRNCDYRTETDFDVRRYDKTFQLENIRTADLFMVYQRSRPGGRPGGGLLATHSPGRAGN